MAWFEQSESSHKGSDRIYTPSANPIMQKHVFTQKPFLALGQNFINKSQIVAITYYEDSEKSPYYHIKTTASPRPSVSGSAYSEQYSVYVVTLKGDKKSYDKVTAYLEQNSD